MQKRARNIKILALLAAFVMLAGTAVGGTLAFLFGSDEPVENTFTPSKVTTEVDEDLTDPKVKKNVAIINTGDTDAWVRAKVLISWKNDKGEVYGASPLLGTDYELAWADADDWNDTDAWLDGDDGYYYWNKPVAQNAKTGLLITSVAPKDTAPEGYALTVEVLGSGIQTKPVDVFNAEWQESGLIAEADENDLPTQLAEAAQGGAGA